LLDYVIPDYVHIVIDGVVVKTGGADLAREVEERGYQWLEAEAALACAVPSGDLTQ
jgi:Fe-S cluster assembly ATP-binding protein